MTRPRYTTQYVHLDEWVSISQAARLIGLTRSRVAQMVDAGCFRVIGFVGDKPLYLLQREEVEHMAAERLADARDLQTMMEQITREFGPQQPNQ